ncbi:MAG: DUF3122 domain-containing protein [Calothrix sp. C42_A2020_038]|nr:DUF3122 domain-containing protein [Calothrix sp. C42_A2020_038]
MQQKFQIYLLAVIFILVFGLSMPSATAILRQHQDSPGVMRYHSQISIKDHNGRAWQVLLYKVKNTASSDDIHLRLVGFPNIVKFVHPQPLEVVTASGNLFLAPDIYAQGSPAANVGEYKFTSLLNKIPTTQSLKLNLPLEGENTFTLKIPRNVITEWQMLVTELD